uniref:ATP synthase complex subunit 8 n=1 Tax=Thylamys elegans TaxID=191871 RepID=Q70XG8_THYEL|nr:ATP synthase F0 subunit 8 [Thylamys elegans]CAD48243.1 ATP synthase F0 subunit 8 [Thylamys elegans]
MPQLDTSTWSSIIVLMILSLFCLFQLKMINHTLIQVPSPNETTMTSKTSLPWENKWTKIYLPHSSHQPL